MPPRQFATGDNLPQDKLFPREYATHQLNTLQARANESLAWVDLCNLKIIIIHDRFYCTMLLFAHGRLYGWPIV